MDPDPKKQRAWIDAIQKEDKLRLKWFRANEEKLIGFINKQTAHHTDENDHIELRENRKKLYGPDREKYPKTKTDIASGGEPTVPEANMDQLYNIMLPVDPNVSKIIYSGNQKGRVKYLNERMKLLPEYRYYFPETTSYGYGWNMWPCAKEMGGSRVGKCEIVKASFYRRRAGVERDPEWYSKPNRLSPSICDCS